MTGEPIDLDAIRAANGYCRTCADKGKSIPADVIVWGKLFPKEALGPRCVRHFNAETGYGVHDAMFGQSAVFDLRPGRALIAEVERLRATIARVAALAPKWDERADDYMIAGADGCADGLNEALHDLRAALDGTP